MSAFVTILRNLVEIVPAATGAIFADWEGEPVGEYSRELPILDLQIAGAQWGVVWTELSRSFDRARLGGARDLIVDCARGSILLSRVTEGYYVVLFVGKEGHLAKAMAELSLVVEALRVEM